jgi:CHAD domain-containing protein/adenylate cyclase class IV
VSLDRPTEVELKYRLIDAQIGERLLGGDSLGPLHARGEIEQTHHDDHYFDTPAGALGAAGWAARIRQTPEGALLSLKSLAASGSSLHRRQELEAPAGPGLQPVEWPPSDARSLVLELGGDAALVETVRLDQTRRRRVFGDDRFTVEVSLDDVRVLRDEAEIDHFLELEVELTGGEESQLGQVAAVLDGMAGFTPSPTSKLAAAQGALAATREPEAPAIDLPKPGKSPGVTAQDTLAEAGRKVFRFHLARMIARDPGTRSGHDPEDLHAMRVATRRLRAAWRVFGSAYRPRRTRKLQRSLRDVARLLGVVRDLDVLIEAGERYAATLAKPGRTAVRPLFDSWRRDRDEARQALIAELDSDGYRRFVQDFGAFVMDDQAAVARVAADQPHLVRDTAPAQIWAAYHTVRAYESVLRWADIETLHALRIDAKRLRYGVEFFRETLGPEGNDLIARIVGLQDHLGLLHDADVAAGLTRQFLLARSTDLEPAERAEVGRYLVHCEQEVARLKRATNGPWRQVEGVGFRRALGRALARL